MIEILTKKQPWPDESISTAISRVLRGEKHPIPSHCPSQLGELLNRCWEFEAVNRPEFSEIFDYLEQVKV